MNNIQDDEDRKINYVESKYFVAYKLNVNIALLH